MQFMRFGYNDIAQCIRESRTVIHRNKCHVTASLVSVTAAALLTTVAIPPDNRSTSHTRANEKHPAAHSGIRSGS